MNLILVILIIIAVYIFICTLNNPVKENTQNQQILSLELQTLYKNLNGKVTVYDYNKLKYPTSKIIFLMDILKNMKELFLEIKQHLLFNQNINEKYINFIEDKSIVYRQYVMTAYKIYEEIKDESIFNKYQPEIEILITNYNKICLSVEKFKTDLLAIILIMNFTNNNKQFQSIRSDEIKYITDIEKSILPSLINLQKNITENNKTFQNIVKLDNEKFKKEQHNNFI